MEKTVVPQTPPKRKKMKIILAAVLGTVVFTLLAMLWFYVPVLGSSESKYCARCHSMVPEYLTWQASGHAQFQCKECHRSPGVTNFFSYQSRLFKEMFFYRSGEGPHKTPEASGIRDSSCLRCHSENRKYSPASDTVVPHRKHTGKGITCVSCHAGIAHGRIVERGVTDEVPAEEWNEGIAAKQMEYKYTTPRMALCLDCHGKRGITEKCSDCHSRQLIPASHKEGDFERQHGIMAQTDFKPCNLCHSYSLREPVDLLEINVRDYIKSNTFCFNCHLRKPSTHIESGFGKRHGELARSRGTGNCLGCHDINTNSGNDGGRPVNKVYCNKCHWFK